MTRPLILIPARFTKSAAALRFEGETLGSALINAVFAAGGEPLLAHPHAPDGVLSYAEVEERFGFVDGVLLPGGADVSPHWYGAQLDDSMYGINVEQDAFDISLANWALQSQVPTLAICRGLQIVNIARGGTLIPDMDNPHRPMVNALELATGSRIGAEHLTISCYHHQALDQLGDGLTAVAKASDGTIEAVDLDADQWFAGVQWHPEYTAATDPAQLAILEAFVDAARTHSNRRPAR